MLIRRRTGWTGHTAPRILLAGLSTLALLASGCSSDGELAADEAATVAEGSQVEFTVDGENWTMQEAGGVIPAGAQVQTHDDQARLAFRGGRVRLSPDAAATLENDRLTLERGEALIASTGGLAARLEDTTIAGAGTYRLASGLSARVGVYSGEVAVARPAQERAVPALRQLDLAQFRLAARPSPLRYVADDAWDRELLAGAIAFDGEAARLRRGMNLELGSKPLPGRFYGRFTGRTAVPALAAAATASRGAAFGPPSDVLLTFFVADASGLANVVSAIERVAALRGAGARWGLIGLDLGVPADEVVAAIDELDNRELALSDLAPDARTPSEAGTEDATGASSGAGDPTTGTSSTGTTTTGGSTGGTPSGGSGGGGGDDGGGGGGGDDDPAPPNGGGKKPGGGGGDDPDPPPTEEPSPVDRVVNDVVDAVDDPPDAEDVDGGGAPLPEELDTVRDVIDGLDN